MNAIKKAWITEYDGDLVSLSFESEIVEPSYMQLKFESKLFPDKPTKKHPLRHMGSIKLLSNEDLEMIVETINKYLDKE